MTSEQSEKPLTPMQALYDLLTRKGYVRNKRDFAAMLRINEGNIYAYLSDPEPRPDKEKDVTAGRNTTRISASPEILHGWCWGITQTTAMNVTVELQPDGNLAIDASGFDAQSKRFKAVRYITVYVDYDFKPPSHWAEEWAPDAEPAEVSSTDSPVAPEAPPAS